MGYEGPPAREGVGGGGRGNQQGNVLWGYGRGAGGRGGVREGVTRRRGWWGRPPGPAGGARGRGGGAGAGPGSEAGGWLGAGALRERGEGVGWVESRAGNGAPRAAGVASRGVRRRCR